MGSLKLSPIHASVIYEIPWICLIQWIPVPFRENSTEAWIGVNLKILSMTCILLTLWEHPGLRDKSRDYRFNGKYFCHWIYWIQGKLK